MKAWALVCWLSLAPALAAAQAPDIWTYEQVQALAQKAREGQGFDEGRLYPPGGIQIAGFEVEGGVQYIIDARAHLCYFRVRQSVTLVPCKSVKNGYPLFAPLITWEN